MLNPNGLGDLFFQLKGNVLGLLQNVSLNENNVGHTLGLLMQPYLKEIPIQQLWKLFGIQEEESVGQYRFDYFLPHLNLVIEYDGEQHFKPIDYFGGVTSFKMGRERDVAKMNYCQQNKLSMIRLSYVSTMEDFVYCLEQVFLNGYGFYCVDEHGEYHRSDFDEPITFNGLINKELEQMRDEIEYLSQSDSKKSLNDDVWDFVEPLLESIYSLEDNINVGMLYLAYLDSRQSDVSLTSFNNSIARVMTNYGYVKGKKEPLTNKDKFIFNLSYEGFIGHRLSNVEVGEKYLTFYKETE